VTTRTHAIPVAVEAGDGASGHVTLGSRFLSAFNDIENHIRAALGASEDVSFAHLMPRYASEKRMQHQHREALRAFTRLRNAISHEQYYDGHPIAEPIEDVVVQIERLRDLIESPPRALTNHPRRDVRIARPSEPISAVLSVVRKYRYSQLPVYKASGEYVALLTTNAIACWLANQLEDPELGLAEDQPVSAVLPFIEPHEVAVHVARSITAAEAIEALSEGGSRGRPATALIVTQNGRPHEKPLALLAADDLPRLIHSLALT
jgi:CBS domain.